MEVFKHVGNVFLKLMYFDFSEGHVSCVGHAHEYDHVTCLAYGKLMVEVDGISRVYHAPAFIDIKAGVHHKMTALIDKTVAYCVHDTRGMDIEDLGVPFEEEKCHSDG